MKTYLRVAAFFSLLLVAACSQSSSDSSASSSSSAPQQSGLMVLNRGNGAEPKSLDPDYIDGIWESQIAGDLLMGLTTEDANGNPIPGVAKSWETSADKLTWTFHLRDETWSDGQPVTADDFVYAWRRILDPKTAAAYAYYLYPIKNAKDVNTGKQPGTALGIAAPDAHTVVITLEHPLPFLPEFLTHQTTFPLPKHVVEAKGQDWAKPGNYVSNGAYVLKEWVSNDHVTLTKNPKFYDVANVKVDVVNYYPTSDADAALKRLRAGELDTQDPIPVQQIDWLRANMKDELRITPALTTFYLVFNLTKRPLQDIHVREALTLAYDRETMAEKVMRLGQVPAYNIVPPGTANYPGGVAMKFKDMSYAERLAKAQSLMREAGYGPDHMLVLNYATANSTYAKPGIAPLQQMWRQAYVDLKIVLSDVQINYQKLQEGDYEVGNAAWVADFNDPSNFLDLLRKGGGNNYGRYDNPKYDALLDQAQNEIDLEKRGKILAEAEQMVLGDYAWAPTLFGVTTVMVQPYVKGWVTNNKEINRTRWLSVEKH
jgi:oligopeptide transport system substrate-binding protein